MPRGLLSIPLVLAIAACGVEGDLTSPGGPGSGFLPPGNGNGNGPGNEDPEEVRFGFFDDAGNFREGELRIVLSPISTGGTTGVQLDLADEDGVRALVDATASFRSSCLERGDATITPDSPSATNGRITASYTAEGCTGSDEITVDISLDGEFFEGVARGTVEFSQQELGSAVFVESSQSIIAMRGGGSTIPESAILTFRVEDRNGAPLRGKSVTFALNPSSNPAGLTLESIGGNTTDDEGEVRVRVRSGSLPTSVRVRMTVTDDSSGLEISTLSEMLIVSTGLPTSRRLSLSASTLNIPGLNCDGEPSSINMRMTDRFGNPAPRGTSVLFHTSQGGQIASECQAGDPLGDPQEESGVCTVVFTSQGDRPANGRVVVLSRLSGELGFDDENGNGFWDPGEPFDAVAEPFLDVNRSGQRDAGEQFFDTNNNGSWDADQSGGEFLGYRCDAPGQGCDVSTAQIWRDLVIVLSGNEPNFGNGVVIVSNFPGDCGDADVCVGAPGPIIGNTVVLEDENQSVDLRVRIRDVNNNPMPAGTEVTLNTEVGTVRDPSTQTVANSNATGGQVFSFSIRGPDGTDPDAGRVSVTTSTPGSECGGPVGITTSLFDIAYSPPQPAPPDNGTDP